MTVHSYMSETDEIFMEKIENVKVTEFASRHFSKTFGGTRIKMEMEEFETIINQQLEIYRCKQIGIIEDVKKGYAPFCREICIENFADAKTGTAEIIMKNYQYLKSGYSGRREGEFPVLTRWLHYPERRFIPKANYLIIILYSREQCLLEHEEWVEKKLKDYEKEKGKVPSEGIRTIKPFKFEFEDDNTEWGIVNIMAQLRGESDPINPSTMIRNHLGKKFGGSGVEINPEEYEKSIEFWSNHAIVK